MFERQAVKLDKAFSGDEGTDSFTIPRGRAISQITLVVRAKNAATHNAPDAVKAETVISAIKKIEIFSGDRVFKSMNAEAAMALATYRYGREPYCDLTQVAGAAHPVGWQEVHIPIMFDRYAMDMQCALPAPNYDSLSMSIEFDFNTTDDGAATAFLTGGANHRYDVYLDVLPHISKEAIGNLKVIETHKKIDYTTKATGWDLLDLSISRTKQLRKIMVQCYKAGEPEGGCIDYVEYMLNGKVYTTNSWEGWQRRNAQDSQLDFVRVVHTKAQTTDDQYFSRIPDAEPQFTPFSTGSEDTYLTTDDDKITLATQVADDIGVLAISSQVIPATIFMDFDTDLSLRELASMNVLKPQLHISNGTADGKLQVYEETIVAA